jgi:hypothetical protein
VVYSINLILTLLIVGLIGSERIPMPTPNILINIRSNFSQNVFKVRKNILNVIYKTFTTNRSNEVRL